MADPVMRILTNSAAIVLILASMPPAFGQAAALPDPTRPPNMGDAPQTDAQVSTTGLQAVILRRHGRSVAVINGRMVAVGEMVGDARLVALTASEAVLSGPGGKEVLRLAPAVDMKQAQPTKPPAKAKKRNTR